MAVSRIALFTEMLDFDNTYTDLIWRSADARCKVEDVDLVICVGGRIRSSDPELVPGNFLFDLALEHPFAGFVAAHICYEGLDHYYSEQLAGRFSKVSAVCTQTLGSVPVVSCENRTGMKQLLAHVFDVHHRKRVIFVTGTSGSSEAAERLQTWVEESATRGLPHSSEWIIQGNFNPRYIPGISVVVRDRILALGADAVVASSDMLADVLLNELPELGIPIPAQVVVTGFDDVPLARSSNLGLTTVRQKIDEQFGQAVSLCLGKTVNPWTNFGGTLVVRGSCGCPGMSTAESEPGKMYQERVSDLLVFASQLNSLDHVDNLGPFFQEWMPRLAIRSWCLSISCDHEGISLAFPGILGSELFPSDPPKFHRVLSWSLPDSVTNLPVFNPSELAPGPWWDISERRILSALPLIKSGNWYGLLLISMDNEANLICRGIQELTSAFLDREHRLGESIRSRVEAEVSAKVEAEKIKVLSTLVAGFAHDLATPFSIGQTSVELLEERLTNLASLYRGHKLTESNFNGILTDVDELLKLLKSNWNRASDLVMSFKRIGTELPRDDIRQFMLVPFLRDILSNLRQMWKHEPIEVTLEGPEDIEVNTKAAPFFDILTNLIQNSLIHAFPDHVAGHIHILVSHEISNDHCIIVFSDDGKGIKQENMGRVFSPFFSTREGQGGTGLGLNIVLVRVQDQLGGTISCESGNNIVGTRFILRFPRSLQK